jgi:uncharacterized membrane protein
MKITIFNTLTAVAGIYAMVKYAMAAGMAASFGPLVAIWAITGAVSLIGTIAMVSIDSAKQNRKEKEYAEFLSKAYAVKKTK